jgi:large subunit ribosomal protein L13
MNKTFIPSSNYTSPKWYIIDAANQTLGRLSTKVAQILQGKTKINFYSSLDSNIYVIIINIEKIYISGNKEKQKLYYRHSGRPGGLKTESLKSLRIRLPEKILEKSIKGMLPKNSLGRKIFTHLKLFKGTDYLQIAQKPEKINIYD